MYIMIYKRKRERERDVRWPKLLMQTWFHYRQYIFYVGCLKPPDSGVDDHPCQPQVSRSFDHGACAVGKCQAVRSILFGTPSATALRHLVSMCLLSNYLLWTRHRRRGGATRFAWEVRDLLHLCREHHILAFPCHVDDLNPATARAWCITPTMIVASSVNSERPSARRYAVAPPGVRVGPCDLARSAWGVV